MLLEERNKYLKSKKNKVNAKYIYTGKMFKTHRHLFEYPGLLENTCIEKIEIDKKNVVFTVRLNNKRILMTCDKNDANSLPMSCLNFSRYDESDEIQMVLKLLKSNAVVFDVGANIGWYTLNILANCKSAKMYCFEPIKASYNHLLKNLSLNKKRAHVFNFGLSDQNKKVQFYFDIQCAMASSMSNLRGHRKTIKENCKIKRLDDFVKSMPKFGKIDLIKCDVEGAEFLVFKGAEETILKYKPIVFSEMLRKWSCKFGYHPNDILEFFRDKGYDCYVVYKDKLRRFGCVDENTKETNYWFFHKEKHYGLLKKLVLK